MKWYTEDSLRNFQFWSGAESTASALSDEQMDMVEAFLEDIEPEEGWSDTSINDIFWHEPDTVANWLGYKSLEHLENGYSEELIEEADDWAEDVTFFPTDLMDCEEFADIFREEDYIDEYGECDDIQFDNDFANWWEGLDDKAKCDIYQKFGGLI